jgi:hypothetical protein
MAGSHASCEQDVADGHIWGTYPDYIPDVNRMFLLGKCWAKCLNACNVLSMFPPKSRYPRPQCEDYALSIQGEVVGELNLGGTRSQVHSDSKVGTTACIDELQNVCHLCGQLGFSNLQRSSHFLPPP